MIFSSTKTVDIPIFATLTSPAAEPRKYTNALATCSLNLDLSGSTKVEE